MHWYDVITLEPGTPLADALEAVRYDGFTLPDEDPINGGEPVGTVNVTTMHWVEVELRVINADAVSWFRYGNCAILAYELHQLTGWPLLTIHAPDADEPFIHAAVRAPNGARFDITGPEQTVGEWEYDGGPVHPGTSTREHDTVEGFLAVVGDDMSIYPAVEREIIRDFARHLLAQHPIEGSSALSA